MYPTPSISFTRQSAQSYLILCFKTNNSVYKASIIDDYGVIDVGGTSNVVVTIAGNTVTITNNEPSTVIWSAIKLS